MGLHIDLGWPATSPTGRWSPLVCKAADKSGSGGSKARPPSYCWVGQEQAGPPVCGWEPGLTHPMAGDPGHRLGSFESGAHSMEKVNTGVSLLVQGDLGDPGVQRHHSWMRGEDVGMVGGSVGVGVGAGFQSCSKCHHSSVRGKAVKLFVAQFSYLKKEHK